MRKLIFLTTFFFTFFTVFAQNSELLAKKSDKGLCVEHTVQPKESFYAIGRKYNVSPKDLAAFNKLDMTKGLNIGQHILIPLTDENFKQDRNSGAPVYHIVVAGEGMMSVSSAHKNVKLTKLREWNDLSNDQLTVDQKLIVGFIQSKELPGITIKPKAKTSEPVAKKEEKPVVEEKKPAAEEKKVEEKKIEEKKVEEKKLPVQEEKRKEPTVVNDVKPLENGQGFFKNYFEQQIQQTPLSKAATVTSSIFKTEAGWQDAKYYLLIDNVSPGTIVRIENPANNKSVFAKVLGQMSGIRQNQGLDTRISNAAAAALAISDEEKFIVKINY